LFVQTIGAIGIGLIVALVRYYTTYFALRWVKGKLRINRRRKEVPNEGNQMQPVRTRAEPS